MDRDLKIRILFEALDKFTRPMRSLNRESVKAAKGLKDARDQVRALNRAGKDLDALRKLREDMRGASNAAEEQRRKMKLLQSQLEAGGKGVAKLRKEYDRSKATIAALDAKQRDQVARFTQLRASVNQAGVSVKDFGAAETALKAKIDAANRSASEQAKKLQAIGDRTKRLNAARASSAKLSQASSNLSVGGASALAAGTAVGMPFIGAIKLAMGMESAMANIKKVVTATDTELKALNDQFLDMSTRVPVSADGLADIAAQGAKAGVAFKELSRFTEDAAKLKIAFDFESNEDAAATLLTWRNAFGITEDKAMKLANQVNALTNVFGGEPAAVSAVVREVGSLAKTAGLSTDAVAALAQTLNMMGVEPEVAATGIQNLMLRISQGSATVPKARKALQGLGLDSVKLAKDMQIDAKGTILDVLTRISKLPVEKQTAALTQIFGRESIQPIAALLTNLKQVRTAFDVVANDQKTAGSVAREYAARLGTTANQVQLAINNFADLGIVLGTQVLPTVKYFAMWVGEVTTKFRKFAAAHPYLIKGLMLVGGLLAGLMVVGGGLAVIMGALLAPFAALTFAAGMLDVTLGALLLPFVGIVAAIVALPFLIAGLIKAWDLLVKAWKNIDWHKIGAGFGDLLMKGLMLGLLGPVPQLLALVAKIGGKVGDAFKKKLGIHSPSRVFAQFGMHTMAGLANGISKGAPEPIRRAVKVAAGMTAAVAAGVAPISAAAAAAPAAHAGQVIHHHYNITINAQPGADAKALAHEVRKVVTGLGAHGSASFSDPD
jgi:TP901 family phage tail tape measure protein